MTKYNLSLWLTLFISLYSFGQRVQVLNLQKKPFEKTIEISSIAIVHDTLILPSEKCKRIFLVNKNNLKNIGEIDLRPLVKDEIEVEGLVLLDNHLYMTDERNYKIWDYDITLKSISSLDADVNLSEFKDLMEGVAISNDTLYLLKEKNSDSQSEVHVYKVNFSTHRLNYLYKIKIILPAKFRYSDLFFDKQVGKMYGIKSSYFRDNLEQNEYFIDEVDIRNIKKDTTINSNSFICKQVLTDTARNFIKSKKRATNFEGVTCDSEFIYVISDNAQTDKNCDEPSKLPLFVKFPK